MNKRENPYTFARERENPFNICARENKYDESESNEETEGNKERERETNSYAREREF